MHDRVLIVEDDLDIANLIRVHLNELGVDVEHVQSAENAQQKMSATHYSLVLLDIMLPGMDGLTLCRKIKEHQPHVSVLMMTSKGSEMDRVIGLEMGADDYICKPFSYREFQARVKAQLRHVHLLRSSSNVEQASTPLVLGALLIDGQSHQVVYQGDSISLTATEFDLLRHFASHPNQVFSRVQLLDSVWGYQHSGYEHTVNSHINRLRAKIEKHCGIPLIETVWGVGYKLNSALLESPMKH